MFGFSDVLENSLVAAQLAACRGMLRSMYLMHISSKERCCKSNEFGNMLWKRS
jgi:hypothetical protein